MSRETLEQRRAQHAWQAIQEFKSEKKAKELAGHAKKLPMRIKAAGLGQALAFLNAKMERDNLLHEALTNWVVTQRQIGQPEKQGLIATLIKGDSNTLRRATDEVMAWLEWFNRFAEAEGLKSE
ncbi:MAG: type III-B CRISPR module-associated protein Cmr5 [Candidatus Sericytochromatia bacterium]|nr:type III-B CRISPR module-associated protein Cmr5 [Candidatus Sericytochromatia bacterium]